MKVSNLVFALVLASTPVLMSGSAWSCEGAGCNKSENTPPADQTAPPVALLRAPTPTAGPVRPDVRVAAPCTGSNCKSEVIRPLDKSAPPAAFRSTAPAIIIAEPPIMPCNGSGC
jgi:hypothetical protein